MQLNNIGTKFLGRKNIYYKTIDSTQNEIWNLINQNVPNGSLVSAGIQTMGKGTHGRIWHTDEENNIAFSFFIKMDCHIDKLQGINIDIAEIIVDLLNSEYGISLSIKQPNDIVFDNKKIGGILTETKIINEIVEYLAIGIGINTSQLCFNKEIECIATSIKAEFDVDVNVEKFIEDFCYLFENRIIERCM